MRNLLIFFSTMLLVMIANIGIAQTKLVYLDNTFKNTVYLKGGLHKPIGLSGMLPDVNANVDIADLFLGKTGLGLSPGWQAELGTIFYFKKMFVGQPYKLGIDWTYAFVEYTEINGSFQLINYPDYFFSVSPVGALGTKVGPCFSFNPVGKIVLDAFAKLRIAYQMIPVIAGEDYSDWGSYSDYDLVIEENLNDAGLNTGLSIGANLRMGPLLIGIEYNTSTIKKNYLAAYSNLPEFSSNIPLRYFNLSVGLNF